MDGLDEADKHILACECSNLQWLVLIDKNNPTGLVLFCALCNSYSGVMKPVRAQDSKVIAQAIAEIDEKKKVERESEEEDWGDLVNETKKPGRILN